MSITWNSHLIMVNTATLRSSSKDYIKVLRTTS